MDLNNWRIIKESRLINSLLSKFDNSLSIGVNFMPSIKCLHYLSVVWKFCGGDDLLKLWRQLLIYYRNILGMEQINVDKTQEIAMITKMELYKKVNKGLNDRYRKTF